MPTDTVPIRRPEDSQDERLSAELRALVKAPVEPVNPEPPRRFGPYEIVRKLGRSMTDVYLARDTREAYQGRLTVLKVVEESNDPYTQTVLVAERRGAAIQKQLRDFDPRFVEIYEYGQMSGAFYVAMEYVEGRSLADMIRECGRIEPQTAARIALEICSQLEKLHSHQAEIDGRRRAIVHGDIKPSNVQITPTGQTRLLDFGIAKVISLTRNLTHHALGSPNYCSPERLASARVDQHCDLWATGVSLYEMVAGMLPFQADDTRKLENLIRSKRPSRPLPADCPEALAAIIRKALAPDLKRRYATASAFGNDLECYLNGRPTIAEQEFKSAETNPTVESVRVVGEGPTPDAAADLAPDSPWQTLLRVRIPTRVGSLRLVRPVWIIAAGVVLIASTAAADLYHRRWQEAAPLRSDAPLANVSTTNIESNWELYQKIQARNAWLPKPLVRILPVGFASRHLKAVYVAEANRIIDSYRKSQDQATTNFNWPRAQILLEHAQELEPADTAIRGNLALVKGYVSLNLAIGAQMSIRQHMQDRVIRSWQDFDQAGTLLPNSPDPHLGLARLYVYSFRDLDKAIEEWNLAEQRHYKLGPREIEQEADGFRLRAQKDLAEQHDRSAAKEDLARAKELYQSIHDSNGAKLVAQDERALNPLPAAPVVFPAKATRKPAAKPAARKPVAKKTRRPQRWQSPKAGKHHKA